MRQPRSPSWVLTGVWLALLAVATLALSMALMLYVPREVRVFDEFGLRLPKPTLWVIHSSAFVRTHWWLVFAVMAAVCGGTLLVRHAFRLPVVGNVFAGVALGLHVGFGLLVVYAMALPWEAVTRGLSK